VTAPILELQHVTKRYGRLAAVDDVSLAVVGGTSLALLGHNGAGKTTLMKLAMGLTRADAGEVTVSGVDPAGRQGVAVRRAIGFLPENVVFPEGMTGRSILRFYGALKGVEPKDCDPLLEEVGLRSAAGQRVKTYSKGMRQRLGLAQALLGRPRLLMLDEPTSGLDPTSRLGFFETVKSLAAGGTTVVLSSHGLTEVETRTDQIAIMKGGRIVASGTLEELRRTAGLPVYIRLVLAPGGEGPALERLGKAVSGRAGDHVLDVACAPEEKMTLMREVLNLGAIVRDVEIRAPTLEEMYARFWREGTGS